MPSPIAHAAMGYAVYRLVETYRPRQNADDEKKKAVPALLLWTLGLSLLPDADAALGVLFGDLARFHNGAMSSPLCGLIISLGLAGAVWSKVHAGFVQWFAVALVCYELHIVMDYMTEGRGVMMLWPFSWARYRSPLPLFYGFHWSSGWVSAQHVWTLLNEAVFAGSLILILQLISPKRARAV